jgi:RimJ/RimL family protein N-acetyltransferase
MWADPEVVRHIRPKPFTREEVWSRLLRHAGLWALLGYGTWVVEEKDSGRFVGEVGFLNYQRDLQPPMGETPEIGWVLAAEAQGKGYATEAVQAAVAWGDRHLGGARTACIITRENTASIHVAKKCGYRELHPVQYKGESLLLFVREPLRG